MNKTPSLFLGIVFCMLLMGVGCVDRQAREIKRTYKQAVKLAAKDDFEAINEAIRTYDEALRYAILCLDGKYDAYKALGITLLQHEMYREAVKAFLAAKQIYGTDSNLHYYLGLAYVNAAESEMIMGQKRELIDKAEASYQEALRLDEDNTIVRYSLGILYGFVKQDVTRGIEQMEMAKSRHPNDVNTLFGLGHLYYRLGRKEQAQAQYESIMELSSKKSSEYQKAKSNLEAIRSSQ